MYINQFKTPRLHRTVTTKDTSGPDLTTFNNNLIETGVNCNEWKYARVDIVVSDTTKSYDIEVYRGLPQLAGKYFLLPEQPLL